MNKRKVGVLYSLTHSSCAELLTVSLCSLRQYYAGDVLCVVSKQAQPLAQEIASDRRLRLQLKRITPFEKHSRHDHRHNKTLAWMQTPFERTVFLDADTLIQSTINYLLDHESFMVTSAGIGPIRGGHNQSLRLWREICNFQRYGPGGKQYCTDVTNTNLPTINSGVLAYSWPKHQHLIERMHDLICLGRSTGRRMTDETIVQMMLPRIHDLKLLDPAWNWTVIAPGEPQEQNIIHWAAQTWRVNALGKSLFAEAFRTAYQSNAGNLKAWCGKGSQRMRRFIEWGKANV